MKPSHIPKKRLYKYGTRQEYNYLKDNYEEYNMELQEKIE